MTRQQPTLTRLGRLALMALILASLSVSGCGKSRGVISGTVKYQGKLVTSGTVVMIGPDEIPASSAIGPDGRYNLEVMPGRVKVGVSSPSPDQTAAADRLTAVNLKRGAGPRVANTPPPAAPPGWFPLPDKFADADKSGVTIDVNGPNDSQDIDLK
jgi:hypothetical protein